MKRLFQIELLKLRKNIAIMVISIIYALVSIFIVFKSTGIKAFYNTETLQFPNIWLTATYVLGFLVIFPVIISIINTTSEFNNKTSRQHIIDGLSRNEFHLSKLISIFIITSIFTIYLLLICLILGFSNGGYSEFFGEEFSFVLGYFLYLFGVLCFVQIFCFLLKKTGLSLGLFLLYYLCIEPILFWSLLRSFSIKNYLPFEVFDSLLFSPFKDNSETIEKLQIPNITRYLEWQNVIVALCYIFIFIMITNTILKKRDL